MSREFTDFHCLVQYISILFLAGCFCLIPNRSVNSLDEDGKTYSEVMAFVASDQTNTLPYSDNFDCTQFTQTLIDNARARGFIASAVTIYFDEQGNDMHDISAFWTTDKGIIWVEPQDDTQYDMTFPGGKLCSSDGFCWGTPFLFYEYTYNAR
jgi:hypothetical protein